MQIYSAHCFENVGFEYDAMTQQIAITEIAEANTELQRPLA